MLDRAVLVAMALSLPACSENDDGGPKTCPDVPCDAGEALTVGKLESGALVPLVDGQELPMERGPQGGQHFYVDLMLQTSEPARWDVAFTLTDEATNELIGQSTERVRSCPCQTLARDMLVFMASSDAAIGTLRANATSDLGGSLSIAPVELSILAPQN